MSARIAVIGAGGIGSQVVLALADRGVHVTAFDRHVPPHEQGSSHGESRIIREAYAEGPQYVPLVRRAWEQWGRLGERAGETLLHATGGVHIGRPDGAYLTSVREVAAAHAIELDSVDGVAGLSLPAGLVAVRERRAGWLAVERAIATALELAGRAGARLRLGEPVTELVGGPRPQVVTAAGRETFDRVVVCAGARTGELVPELAPALTLERQALIWCAAPAVSPPAIWFAEIAPERFVYGFPPDRFGLKLATHHDGHLVHSAEVDHAVADGESAAIRRAAAEILTTPPGAVVRSRACLYTNTPDRDFAIGPLPGDECVIVVSACSGHGFKFAPATGEAAAALALGERPPIEVGGFTPARLL